MLERSTPSKLHVAIVEVFAPQGRSGLRVGVCAAPLGTVIDQFDRDWCDDVRQTLGLAVLLVPNGAGLISAQADGAVNVPARAFDSCGEMTPPMAATIAALVSETVIRSLDPEQGQRDQRTAGVSPDALGRFAWMPLHGVSTCRVRRTLLAPVGLAMGLRRSDIDSTLPSVVATLETSTLIVPMKDRATVESVQPDSIHFAEVCDQLGIAGCLIYAPTAVPTRVVARLLMPGIRSSETIASPVAAGALAKTLIAHGLLDRTATLGVEQLGPNGEVACIEIVVEAQPRSRKVWAGGNTRFTGWTTIGYDRLLVESAA